MTKAAKDQREKSVKVGSRGLLFSVSYGGCSDYAGKSFFLFLTRCRTLNYSCVLRYLIVICRVPARMSYSIWTTSYDTGLRPIF